MHGFDVKRGEMKFVRYSVGLKSVRQENKRAPVKYGMWAFPWPYLEWFFMSFQSKHDPKWYKNSSWREMSEEERDELALKYKKWLKLAGPKLHTFYHGGPIYSVLNTKGVITHDWMSGTGSWNLLTIEQYIKAAQPHIGYWWYDWRKDFVQTGKKELRLISNSNDYLEVFIPDRRYLKKWH